MVYPTVYNPQTHYHYPVTTIMPVPTQPQVCYRQPQIWYPAASPFITSFSEELTSGRLTFPS